MSQKKTEDIVFIRFPIRISDKALEAWKSETKRRKIGSISELIEKIGGEFELKDKS